MMDAARWRRKGLSSAGPLDSLVDDRHALRVLFLAALGLRVVLAVDALLALLLRTALLLDFALTLGEGRGIAGHRRLRSAGSEADPRAGRAEAATSGTRMGDEAAQVVAA